MAPLKRTQANPPQPLAAKRPCIRADYPNTNGDSPGAEDVPAVGSDIPHAADSQSLVWATNRQSLCDALPYFKSHQSGIYTQDCYPQGILLARNGEVGDILLETKCIYSLGGREMKEDGTWIRRGEYEPGHFEQWKTTRDKQLPVMVLMDCRRSDFSNIDISSIPRKSDITPVYIVLGAFFVTEMWQEAVSTEDGASYPVFKVMLQAINPRDKPSFWKGVCDTPQPDDFQESFSQHVCDECGKSSPAAFKDQSSICLNKECKVFFTSNVTRLQRHTLEYATAFLNWIKPYSGDRTKISDTVPLPPSKETRGYGTELRCRTGMVCPNCHHCDSRVFFNYWKCSSCGLIHMAEPDPYPLTGTERETQEHTKKLSKSNFFKADGTTVFMAALEEMKSIKGKSSKRSTSNKKNVVDTDAESETKGFVTKFSTRDHRSARTIYMIFNPDHKFIGSLVHERPSTALKESPYGANELWSEIQEPGVTTNFKRSAARCSGSIVEKLTRHFTQNFGAHYDFGVKVDDTSFDAAPDVVLKSLVHLSHMGKQAVESTQKIFKEEGYEAIEDSTIMDPWKQPNELLALAYMEKDTISYHDDGEEQLTGVISTLSLGSPATMKLRFKRVKADKNKGTKASKPYVILDLQLQHGDVVTMCDTRLQAFTEHTIVPVGIRRFAMTSRVIKDDYYLEQKAARKLEKLNITLNQMKESAQIPTRAANFVFEGTKLETSGSS